MVMVRSLAGCLVLLAGSVSSVGAAPLNDTAWQLVEIASMNDSVDAPADPTGYTLELRADGTALIRADCNRGTGSWASETDGELQFGPVAATNALCLPGSLSEKLLAQLAWVRSYVVRDGHLFLATMADGSIIEFAPAAPVAARVFGDDIRASDAAVMQDAVLTRLFQRYAEEKGIGVQPSELEKFLARLRRADEQGTGKDPSPEDTARIETLRREMATSTIRQWKINKSLYEAYGGRIIYQQFGPEPFDAYRKFLEEQERSGAFTIVDPSMADAFWAYFVDESKHDFMTPGSADQRRAFTVPPWEADE